MYDHVMLWLSERPSNRHLMAKIRQPDAWEEESDGPSSWMRDGKDNPQYLNFSNQAARTGSSSPSMMANQ